jgi:hypothetical protein
MTRSIRQYEQFGKFGSHGNDVGRRAIGVLSGLSWPLPEVARPDGSLIVWSDDDFRA